MSLLDAAREEAKSDMTPLIDCVFLMIVFFVCIDFRVLEAKLPAHLPRDAGDRTTIDPPLPTVSVEIVCDEVGEARPRHPERAGEDPATGRPRPFLRVGHRIHWRVGPRPIGDPEALATLLAGIHADRSGWNRDPDPGNPTPPEVVVDPGPGTTYGDVARTVDLVRGAGFPAVRFAAPRPPVRAAGTPR